MRMTDYQGPERRAENKRLDDAILEVQKLYGTAEILANAVANTTPKQELESLRTEIKREFQLKLIYTGVLTVAAVLFLVIFIHLKLASNNRAINKGHDAIVCMLTKTELQRTGDFADPARVACEQRAG